MTADQMDSWLVPTTYMGASSNTAPRPVSPSVWLVVWASKAPSSKWWGLCLVNIHGYQLVVHAPWHIGDIILGPVLLVSLEPPLVIVLEGSPGLVVVPTAWWSVSLVGVLEPSEGTTLESSSWAHWSLCLCLHLASSSLFEYVLQ
jgi:hypothetical protein